jgi:hypothetical protein
MFFAFFKFSHQAFLQKKLMFDVQSVRWSGQAEFHISAVADQKSGQFNQKNYIFVINDVSYEVLGFRSYVPLS